MHGPSLPRLPRNPLSSHLGARLLISVMNQFLLFLKLLSPHFENCPSLCYHLQSTFIYTFLFTLLCSLHLAISGVEPQFIWVNLRLGWVITNQSFSPASGLSLTPSVLREALNTWWFWGAIFFPPVSAGTVSFRKYVGVYESQEIQRGSYQWARGVPTVSGELHFIIL